MKGNCPGCGNEVEVDQSNKTVYCKTCKKRFEINLFSTAAGSRMEIEDVSAELVSGNRPDRMGTNEIFKSGTIIGQYEIEEFIGKGGMGAVYKAKHLMLDRLVALKVLPKEKTSDPEFVERFKREAKILAQLHHPNIVAVYDMVIQGEIYAISMEYVEGTNMRVVLTTQKFTPEQALNVVPKLCDALEYAHSMGIVHRDIKPENILMDKKGEIKIADFGLAKLIQGDKPPSNLTMSGEVMGTQKYMAPEQLKDPKKVDHRADIYSLGAVFYEILTGEVPIGKFNPPSRKVRVDVRLDKVVLKALESEPDMRYQRASIMGTDVRKISDKKGSGAYHTYSEQVSGFKGWIDSLDQGQKKEVYGIGFFATLFILSLLFFRGLLTVVFLAVALILTWRFFVFGGKREKAPGEKSDRTTGWYVLEVANYLVLLVFVGAVIATIVALASVIFPTSFSGNISDFRWL